MSPLVGVAAPRFDGAACLNRWSLFDVPEADDPDHDDRIAAAVRLCSTCPALIPCGRWVESLPPSQRPTGVVAGELRTTPTPRKRESA